MALADAAEAVDLLGVVGILVGAVGLALYVLEKQVSWVVVSSSWGSMYRFRGGGWVASWAGAAARDIVSVDGWLLAFNTAALFAKLAGWGGRG